MQCPRCGLSLVGVTGNACPRCGQPLQASPGPAQPGQPGYGWPPQAPQAAPPGWGQPANDPANGPGAPQQPGWGQPAGGAGRQSPGWGQPTEGAGAQQPGWGQPAPPSRPFGAPPAPPSYGAPSSYGAPPSTPPAYGAPPSYGSPPAFGSPPAYGAPPSRPGYGMDAGMPGAGFNQPAGPSRPLGGMMAPPAPPKAAKKGAGMGRRVLSAVGGILVLIVIGVVVSLAKGALFNAVGGGPGDSYSLTSTAAGWVDDNTGCAFKSDGYHITQSVICYAPSNDVSNGTITVTMSQVSGDKATPYGLIFHRTSEGNFYAFQIDSQGDFALTKVVNKSESNPLAQGTSSALATGAGAKNTLSVRIAGAHITLSINGTQVGQADDSTFSSGKSGLAGNDNIDVVFTNFSIQR